MMKEMKYYASCSFGKDSLATVLLAHEHNEPLDGILYVELMFNEWTSAEHPLHRDFIHNVAIPRIKELTGIDTVVLRPKRDYKCWFFHNISRGPRKGEINGFPLLGRCSMCREKLETLDQAVRRLRKDGPVTEYVGIAPDEEDRLRRQHRDPLKVSLLEKYGCTEKDARALCEKYGLLSPVYSIDTRNGCWFCPAQPVRSLVALKRDYPVLYGHLLSLSDVPGCRQFKFRPFREIDREVEASLAEQTLFPPEECVGLNTADPFKTRL